MASPVADPAATHPVEEDDPMQGSGDENQGEAVAGPGGNVSDDSSEEPEEDEEEERRIREGFIVDEDEDDEEEDEEEERRRRRKRRKKHHRRRACGLCQFPLSAATNILFPRPRGGRGA